MTLLVASGFVFGGLMFGPDLDIYSRQFQRWGFLRWIWLPYQRSLRHRSFLSHGPIIGTTLRVIYLSSWLTILAIAVLFIFAKWENIPLNLQDLSASIGRSLLPHYGKLLALWVGLEVGAMSHSVSDWSFSAYKRIQKLGFWGWLNHGKIKKRQVIRNSRVKK